MNYLPHEQKPGFYTPFNQIHHNPKYKYIFQHSLPTRWKECKSLITTEN